ncbi:hypothetical protein MCAMS1_00116 [biofilm metagenome]
MMSSYPFELLITACAAMLAPILAALPKQVRVPVVVIEIVLGIVIGPNLLGLASPNDLIDVFAEFGLTFLLFMVGMEIDFDKIKGRPLSLAIGGWGLSLAVALVFMFIFNGIGLIQTPPLLAGVALTTTALGVLLPILRDRNELDTTFGTYMVAAAAAGEFGPLVIISMLLIPSHSAVIHTFLMVMFVIVAFVAANIALSARPSGLIDILKSTMQSSGQLPVRICILIQILFVALAEKFGMNIVMGAFTAGMLVSLTLKGKEGDLLRDKLDAIGFGFLIPIFFIAAGMKFDISALWSSPMAPVQVALLSGLLVLVRGIPLLLYKNELAPEEQIPFVFYSATGLPLIVIISEIGVSSGYMPQDKASVLVSAGMLSVILFPILALRWRGKPVLT